MTARKFVLAADVTAGDPAKIQGALIELVGIDAVLRTDHGFHVRTTVEGRNAIELNRGFLSALRRTEPSATLRSEWTCDGMAEQFVNFDPLASRGAIGREVTKRQKAGI
ncbi:MAG: hypothetical protein M1378_11300 [Bacteroidetes bacterium]|nr:hypothetical protein [Bacteroidota bacterium]